MNDNDILQGLLTNDYTVTRYVYQTFAPAVHQFVLYNSGTTQDAKDLFQEVFIKVLMNIREGRYQIRANIPFAAYFLTIARNTWLTSLRKTKPVDIDNNPAMLFKQADELDNDALLQLVLHDARMEALTLTWNDWDGNDCHKILKKYHLDKEKIKDIAAAEVGINENAMKKRLFVCRKKLFGVVSKLAETLKIRNV